MSKPTDKQRLEQSFQDQTRTKFDHQFEYETRWDEDGNPHQIRRFKGAHPTSPWEEEPEMPAPTIFDAPPTPAEPEPTHQDRVEELLERILGELTCISHQIRQLDNHG